MKLQARARLTLAEFLRREIGDASLRSWAARNGLNEKEVQRAARATTGMTIDKLQVFADALGVDPWQLLFPGYERDAPEYPSMSTEAVDLARRVDQIGDEATRRRAVAAIVNILEMLPAAPPPEGSPAEPISRAPDTTHRRTVRS